MKYTHPETGVEYHSDFIGFSVFSDIETEHNKAGYMQLKCFHEDYEVAKKQYDKEIMKHVESDLVVMGRARSVKMIYSKASGYGMEGLIVHKWQNY
jgi:hypothetical protein